MATEWSVLSSREREKKNNNNPSHQTWTTAKVFVLDFAPFLHLFDCHDLNTPPQKKKKSRKKQKNEAFSCLCFRTSFGQNIPPATLGEVPGRTIDVLIQPWSAGKAQTPIVFNWKWHFWEFGSEISGCRAAASHSALRADVAEAKRRQRLHCLSAGIGSFLSWDFIRAGEWSLSSSSGKVNDVFSLLHMPPRKKYRTFPVSLCTRKPAFCTSTISKQETHQCLKIITNWSLTFCCSVSQFF